MPTRTTCAATSTTPTQRSCWTIACATIRATSLSGTTIRFMSSRSPCVWAGERRFEATRGASMSDVVIFGISDFGRIAHNYLQADSPHNVVAFTVHGDYVDRSEMAGLPVIAFEELEQRYPPSSVRLLVATGFSKVNQVRSSIFEECKGRGYEFISYTNSRAMVWDDVPIGENTFVFEANVIQPGVGMGSEGGVWGGT